MSCLNALLVEECAKVRLLTAVREMMNRRGFVEVEGGDEDGEISLHVVLEGERRALVVPGSARGLEASAVLELARELDSRVTPIDVEGKVSRRGTTLKRTMSELRPDGSLRVLDSRSEFLDGQFLQDQALWGALETNLFDWFESGQGLPAKEMQLHFSARSFTGNPRLDGIVVALRRSRKWKRDAGPGGAVQFLAEDASGLRQGFFVSESEASLIVEAMKSRYTREE